MSHVLGWEGEPQVAPILMADWSENKRRQTRQRLNVQGRDDGSDHRGFIDHQLVEGAVDLVRGSAVLPKLGYWHTLERKGPGGRPAVYASRSDSDNGRVGVAGDVEPDSGFDNRDQLILVCTYVLQMLGEAPQLASVTDLVQHRLAPVSKRLLGIPTQGKGASDVAVMHRVRRAWKRFTAVCDPFPTLAGGTRMRRSEVDALQQRLDPDASEVKMARLRWVMNRLLEATVQLLDEETRAAWTGHISLDATPIEVWGKRGNPTNDKKVKPTDSMSPEWYAGWYNRHDDTQVWAYAMHLAVATPDPYNPGPFPVLAVAASMDTPNKRSGENATAICRSIVERGHPAGDMVTDRGYFGQCLAEDFNRPIEALGYRLIGDYKKDQLGVMATVRGSILVEGNFYSPNMPQHLIDAKKTFNQDNDWKSYQKRIRQRSFFLAKRHDKNRYACPALGTRATVSCPVRPDGPLRIGPAPASKEYVVAHDAPEHRGDLCSQGTVKIESKDVGPYEKLVQDLQHGSQEWDDRYRPARSMVEGYNGYTKDGKHEQLAMKENRRVRGFAANALVAVVGLVATNVRKIRSFYKAGMPLPSEPKTKPVKGEFTGPPSWISWRSKRPDWETGGSPPLAA
ncbi:hypothetical protein SAMN05192575_101927 [Nocardioides alpinus]|uniref:Uncharacterized protein n=1 Tax=Nocardioides alpinus TaxID=748909 RepID=A0A1I0WDH4_9ACTN|nr:hypothetical protein [Nocardioides alpinus]PKH37861.1 hypothetical protein CXG46_20965 [Nocardioides alpinus]SFA86805.1 hypothetical protein SAMN05192575_101927 [Nocardioides alpinus]